MQNLLRAFVEHDLVADRVRIFGGLVEAVDENAVDVLEGEVLETFPELDYKFWVG
jgi:hypothetical protein